MEGDPTQDVTATRAIVGVWKDGVRVDRDAYRVGLTAQREAAEAQTRALAEADAAPVSDFEAGNPSVAFGQPWVVSTDVVAGGASEADLQVVEGGAAGSGHALLVEGEVRAGFVFPWAGAMFMPGAEPFAGADLSSKPTLHFFAKGEGGPYRVQVFCDNLGQIPAEQPFEVGPEWQPYALDLATFNAATRAGCRRSSFQPVRVRGRSPFSSTKSCFARASMTPHPHQILTKQGENDDDNQRYNPQPIVAV